MKSMISYSGILAAALCGGVLAGCNAVEDVRDEPFTPIPAQEVVLEGTIYGLGSRRSLVLLNNDEVTRSFLAPAPQPAPPGTDPDAPSVTLMPFGNVKVGSAYNITVKTQPYGKTCTVNNGSGIIGPQGASPAITINCVNSTTVPRFSVTVSVPNTFFGLEGAKVSLTTEEAVKEITAATAVLTPHPTKPATHSQITFPNALFTNPAGTALFDYTVSASTLEGGATITNPNRCGVLNPINTASVTANVTNPEVQPCTFTIGGNVGYSSLPVGPNTVPAISGLVLQLRDKTGAPLQDLPIPTFTPAAPALHTAVNTVNAMTGVVTVPANTQAYTFTYPARSNQNGVYEVVVLTHPTGQHCVVSDGSGAGGTATGAATPARVAATSPTNTSAGGVTLYQTSRTGIPVNINNMNIRCRVRPAAANQLTGTYFITRGDRFARTAAAPTSVTTGTAPNTTVTTTTVVTDTTVTYRASAPTEFGCSNASAHVNHTATQVVSTRVEVRTNPGNVLQSTTDTPGGTSTTVCDANNFRVMVTFFDDGTFLTGTHGVTNSIEQGFYYYDPVGTPADGARLWLTLITDTGGTGTANPTNGLGSFPGYQTVNGLNHLKMYNVVKTATVPPSPEHPRGTLGTITGRMSGPAAVTTAPVVDNVASVVMTEAFSIPAQMTGSWVTKDHRRVWNYDFNSTYGFHVGVNGGANNLQEACYTLSDVTLSSGFYTRRGSATGCYPVSVFAIGGGTIDLPSSTGIPTVLSLLPGFVGRMPGSETAFDGRATSPIFFHIGTPASFFTAADPLYFQSTDLSWCTTEVLGVAASLNQRPAPGNPTVYFCRHRAN